MQDKRKQWKSNKIRDRDTASFRQHDFPPIKRYRTNAGRKKSANGESRCLSVREFVLVNKDFCELQRAIIVSTNILYQRHVLRRCFSLPFNARETVTKLSSVRRDHRRERTSRKGLPVANWKLWNSSDIEFVKFRWLYLSLSLSRSGRCIHTRVLRSGGRN